MQRSFNAAKKIASRVTQMMLLSYEVTLVILIFLQKRNASAHSVKKSVTNEPLYQKQWEEITIVCLVNHECVLRCCPSTTTSAKVSVRGFVHAG
jgi:hypothetical protein